MFERQMHFIETGCVCINKTGEPICGDFFRLFENKDKKVFVLSDGLGSGVKANILSTLTATILGTMLSHDIPLDECVGTVAASLPICRTRKLAYSTFTVLQLERNVAHLVQYDNPSAIVMRNGKRLVYETQVRFVGEKEIHESSVPLQENDILVLMTDGVTNAGIGKLAENGWGTNDLAEFLERLEANELSAPRIAARIADGCKVLSENSLDDDTSVLVVKIRSRQVVNMMVGPPENKNEDDSIMNLFFSKNGIRVVCGGSTAHAVSKYMNKPLRMLSDSSGGNVPYMSQMDGVDYVTEGILTLKKVLELCTAYLEDPMILLDLCRETDAASQLAVLLIERATDINIYFGMAANVSHEGTEIDFDTKLALIKQLEACLNRLQKQIKISFC
ncbi:SpoIIE family protein phosphatase [Anoxybacterium hadale]|uniref:SpoIIE family protein phosphatase n=1 Tax=Anoxybacterium hadale TaxID=3408580 RepID=A0ACD1AAS0_9FIRM|nr:SpoIIE family protein phosphatase [Clostridiales bacterium]